MSNGKSIILNIYESGITEKWFSLMANTLITAAAMIGWWQGSTTATFIATISYLFLMMQSIHGTREPYEYLKLIYVYPESSTFKRLAFDFAFFMFRAHIIISPFALVWWAYSENKIPL